MSSVGVRSRNDRSRNNGQPVQHSGLVQRSGLIQSELMFHSELVLHNGLEMQHSVEQHELDERRKQILIFLCYFNFVLVVFSIN